MTPRDSDPPTTLQHPGRDLFPATLRDQVFINAAYMSPEPTTALAALRATTDRMACPDFHEQDFFTPPSRVRELVARHVGGAPERFSLTGSASFGTATVAWNLRVRAAELVGTRREILGVAGQFPSNVQTWQHLAPYGFRLTLVEGGAGATDRLVEALNDNTALVATEPLSWTDGTRLDLERLVPAARSAGAMTLLDVTQSAGVDAPIAEALPVDIVLGAGYKWMLGPYGTGFLRLTEELQEKLEPLEWNWKNFEGASDFNRLTEYREEFANLATKFDHGESSAFLRVAGWEAGLKALDELGPGAVAAHTHAFARALRDRLDLDRFEMSDIDSDAQATHLFRVAPRRAEDFDSITQELTAAGIGVSRRAGGFRISPHVYNGDEHLDRLAGALSTVPRETIS